MAAHFQGSGPAPGDDHRVTAAWFAVLVGSPHQHSVLALGQSACLLLCNTDPAVFWMWVLGQDISAFYCLRQVFGYFRVAITSPCGFLLGRLNILHSFISSLYPAFHPPTYLSMQPSPHLPIHLRTHPVWLGSQTPSDCADCTVLFTLCGRAGSPPAWSF